MNSDVQVSISGGLPFDEAGVTGVSITYGYNMIPCATLTLNVGYLMANNPGFFENPTQYKKSTKKGFTVNIEIKSSTGCLNFSGFFDGLSVVQTPGGMEYTALIKNRFQVLSELYPKMMGLYPGSLLVGRMSPNLLYHPGSDEYAAIQAGADQIDAGLSPVEWYIAYLKRVIDSQRDPGKYFGNDSDLSDLRKVIEKTSYKENLDQCDQLLSAIDVSNAKTEGWKVSRDLPYHLGVIAYGGDDCWSLLLNVMNACGCILLASDKKLYVIPQSNFMKLDGSCPQIGQQSTTPNQAYPADYSNFVLNDNSYKNIRYCLVQPSSATIMNLGRCTSPFLQQLGQYPTDDTDIEPDDGSSGILLVETPPWLGRTIAGQVWMHTKNATTNQENAYSKVGKTKDLDSVDTAKDAVDSISEEVKSKFVESEDVKKLLNDYAKARFLTEKYIERTGSFSLQFNPKWVPGTTGFLASRQPKVMFNFFVTGVSHTISTHGARSGTASTQVSFNSARYGGSAGVIPGTDSNELYGYTPGKMKSVQQTWLSDNNANFSPRK